MEFYHWVCLWSVMVIFALFWLAYTIRIILNDEVRMEKRRRYHRLREERRRAEDDKNRKKRNPLLDSKK